jgi:hypothetical protein
VCVSLLWIGLSLLSSTCPTCGYVTEKSPLRPTYRPPVSPGFAGHVLSVLVTRMIVSLAAAKFKPHIVSVSGFALPSDANLFILVFLYDVSSLPAQFSYSCLYTVHKVASLVDARRYKLGGREFVSL